MQGFSQCWNYFEGKTVPAQGASLICGTWAPTVELTSVNGHVVVCFCHKPLNWTERDLRETGGPCPLQRSVLVFLWQVLNWRISVCEIPEILERLFQQRCPTLRGQQGCHWSTGCGSLYLLYDAVCSLSTFFCFTNVFMTCTINFNNSEMSLLGSLDQYG